MRLLWLPFAAMVLAAAVFGYRAGRVPLDSEIIVPHAERYVRERGEGAALTDCVARPGDEQVRVVLRCAHPLGDVTVMQLDLRGRLLDETVENAGP